MRYCRGMKRRVTTMRSSKVQFPPQTFQRSRWRESEEEALDSMAGISTALPGTMASVHGVRARSYGEMQIIYLLQGRSTKSTGIVLQCLIMRNTLHWDAWVALLVLIRCLLLSHTYTSTMHIDNARDHALGFLIIEQRLQHHLS